MGHSGQENISKVVELSVKYKQIIETNCFSISWIYAVTVIDF